MQRRPFLASMPALATLPTGSVRAAEPLRIGLAPYLSPTALLNAFRPLREHLERALAQPVEMTTARDFRSLIDATRRFDHDVSMLPAHIARLAMTDWHWHPVAATLDSLDVLVLVRDEGPVRSPADLAGRRAGMLDPLAFTATVGLRWLQEQGLDKQVAVLALASISSALHALRLGEVDMVVATDSQLRDLPDSTPRGQRILARVADIPGPIYMARPDMPAETLARLRAAMAAFRPDPARPRTAANAALHLPDAALLQRLDPYAAIVRTALQTPR